MYCILYCNYYYQLPQVHIIKDKLFTHSLSGLMIYMERYFIDNYSNTFNLVNCFVCLYQ